MDLRSLTIKSFGEGLRAKKFSTREIVADYFHSIEKQNKDIHAYLSLQKEHALKVAESVDKDFAAGEELHSLAGIPLAVKDNILIEGGPATASSRILEKYVSSYDATVVKKLKKAEAVFLGKTNLDEFAMGSSTENSAFGPTKNPHDMSRVPGGSSGGSAAAVASDMALGALGSDTGGSIRQPAAFCGVVGMKPTYGAVSRYGLIAMASSLDQIGPFAKTVEDAAILFHGIAGRDENDATSFVPEGGWGEVINPDFSKVKNLTIGIPDEYFIDGLDSKIVEAIQGVIKTYNDAGIKTKRVSLPHTKYALSVYYVIQPAEVSSNLARFDGIRYGVREAADNLQELYVKNKSVGYGAEPKRRIILGTFVLSSGYYDAYYGKAQKVRALIKQDFDEAFREADVILAPVTPTLPFKIGEKTADPLQMYLSDVFTIPANLAGLPAISIPVKGVSGLPIGFQLMGRSWREADIFGLGQLYENL